MKKILFLLLFLCGCRGIVVPDSFTYKEIETDTYKLASWQKISDCFTRGCIQKFDTAQIKTIQ